MINKSIYSFYDSFQKRHSSTSSTPCISFIHFAHAPPPPPWTSAVAANNVKKIKSTTGFTRETKIRHPSYTLGKRPTDRPDSFSGKITTAERALVSRVERARRHRIRLYATRRRETSSPCKHGTCGSDDDETTTKRNARDGRGCARATSSRVLESLQRRRGRCGR